MVNQVICLCLFLSSCFLTFSIYHDKSKVNFIFALLRAFSGSVSDFATKFQNQDVLALNPEGPNNLLPIIKDKTPFAYHKRQDAFCLS